MKYKKYTIDTIQEITENRPIRFLSKEYTRIDFKHDWKCSKCSHVWQATPNNIRQGNGCPKCAGKAYTKEEIVETAEKRGILLIGTFTKMTSKTSWVCADGHTWSATPFSVVTRGTGCPKCRSNISEEKCRFIFESLTGYLFSKNRIVLSGKELDGYCYQLGMAFEYQGEQHYKKVYYHRSGRDLKTQQDRDKQKRGMCKKLGIKLIEIPYTQKNLEHFIANKLNISGEVDWSKFSFRTNYLNELKEILLHRNIQCLSKSYLGDGIKLELECMECSHLWKAAPTHLKGKNPTGCPKCGIKISARKRRKS